MVHGERDLTSLNGIAGNRSESCGRHDRRVRAGGQGWKVKGDGVLVHEGHARRGDSPIVRSPACKLAGATASFRSRRSWVGAVASQA